MNKGTLYAPALADRLRGVESSAILAPLFEESAGMDRINQALYIDARFLLPGNNLVKPDRMGMAVSIEARTPFLDYRMMELAFRMPGSLKLAHGETKYIYKKAVRPLIGDGLTVLTKLLASSVLLTDTERYQPRTSGLSRLTQWSPLLLKTVQR